METLKVMRLAQQDIVRLGKVSQSNLTSTVFTLGTSLVEFTSVQGNLWVGGVDRLGARAALVGRSTVAVEFLHAFLNARHGYKKT